MQRGLAGFLQGPSGSRSRRLPPVNPICLAEPLSSAAIRKIHGDARQILERLGAFEGDHSRLKASTARRMLQIEIGRLRFSSTRSGVFPDVGIEVVSADPRDLFKYRLLDELLAQSGPMTANCRKCDQVFWKVGKREFCSERCRWSETKRRLRAAEPGRPRSRRKIRAAARRPLAAVTRPVRSNS